MAEQRLRGMSELVEVSERMAETLRIVLVVAEQDPPYPWRHGALKYQIRKELTDYEALGLDEVPR